MVKLIPYLFTSNSLEAIESYKKVFGAELVEHNKFTKEVGQGMNLPDDFDYESSTMHAELKIGGDTLYLADSLGEHAKGRVDVLVACDSQEQIESYYENAKAEGYDIRMTLEKQFWGAYFASFVDRWGIGWQLNYTIPKES